MSRARTENAATLSRIGITKPTLSTHQRRDVIPNRAKGAKRDPTSPMHHPRRKRDRRPCTHHPGRSTTPVRSLCPSPPHAQTRPPHLRGSFAQDGNQRRERRPMAGRYRGRAALLGPRKPSATSRGFQPRWSHFESTPVAPSFRVPCERVGSSAEDITIALSSTPVSACRARRR